MKPTNRIVSVTLAALARARAYVALNLALAIAFLMGTISSFAADANTNAVSIVDDAEATFLYVLPKAIGVLAALIGIAIGLKVWKRITSK